MCFVLKSTILSGGLGCIVLQMTNGTYVSIANKLLLLWYCHTLPVGCANESRAVILFFLSHSFEYMCSSCFEIFFFYCLYNSYNITLHSEKGKKRTFNRRFLYEGRKWVIEPCPYHTRQNLSVSKPIWYWPYNLLG